MALPFLIVPPSFRSRAYAQAAVRRYAALGAVTFDVTLPNGANATQHATFVRSPGW